ncbi:DUF883 domain containing protein [Sulfitobacter noctilucicola]|uniref:ElaB/YqjD/DUF883 family membrane-anchored ribosome-binding protein n=1 Tax=Sulfitobacter noctilucicola TaxID=1342301 RepID=A0A7W6M5M1_9RHOB|nr:DUF883 C-terminal domain-containing protein [Sulfitobacter noctilucicola]KIN62939.1 DUF883 domain containing protein [Sulfitobacter noctilucicola]MBB4172533.1 ElaB/YqjD/DUF883 family membrane-anchored ribosome-binding protein [Sulfitobacter noctilucicola]
MATSSTTQKNGISNKTDISVEDLSKQIELLKSDIAGLTSSVSEYTVAKGTAAKDTAKAKAEELAAAGKDKALEAQLHTEEFIRTQPATALGIAAGVGFLVGMITARR